MVARFALQNAASVAGRMLTTEAMIAEKPEKKKDSALPPGSSPPPACRGGFEPKLLLKLSAYFFINSNLLPFCKIEFAQCVRSFRRF
jgi:hypothetical protein